jgi:thioester reductase-like protein
MSRVSSVDNLELKAVLDSTLQFKTPVSENSANPKRVFLTGATGFLGAYLLDELLHKTTADIYCLIRGSDPDSAKHRLKNHLDNYKLWREEFSVRIIPIVGDLSQPLLGLSEQQFGELAGQIDVIYHSGGLVDHVRRYAALKPTNVFGTQEVLRLAGLTQTKPVHFISTLAVFFCQPYLQARRVSETDVPVFDASLKGGYKQSKWVAERLVMTAQERGLPACIYRPIRITGHSKTGMTANLDALLNLLIKACILMRTCPTLEIDLPLLPVDYVSQAIVHLSGQERLLGKAFHFFHPKPIPWKSLCDIIRVLGYPLEETPYDGWRSELKARASQDPEKAFFSHLRLLLISPNNLFIEKPQYDAPYTRDGLAGTSIVCPSIDKELISTYFSYFQKVGFIPVGKRSRITI